MVHLSRNGALLLKELKTKETNVPKIARTV